MRGPTVFAGACLCALLPALAFAQAATAPALTAADTPYVPIQARERISWVVDGEVSPRSLLVGAFASGERTLVDTPEEWRSTWSGFGKRFLNRQADVAISGSIEAGVGAFWGEDPRYLPSKRHGAWPRIGYALKTVFLAPRRDGRLAPAWGRVAGNVFNNMIENTWLPPSMTTPGQTALASADGFIGRALGNLWDEFEPDLRRVLRR